MEEWNEYFRGLLGGVEWKTVWERGREEGKDERGRAEMEGVQKGSKQDER